MTAHVVVIGDAAVDIVARPSTALVFGDDVRSRITMSPGGAAANTAAWLAFLGVSVTLVSRIGDDPGGELLRRSLTAAGVRCAFTVDPDAATGSVVALVDPEGQRTMMSDRGANARLAAADVDAAVLAGATHLHLSGYVLLDPSSRQAGIAALKLARAAGLTTSVDPQSAAMIDNPREVLELLHGVDLLLPNAAELATLTRSGLSETGLSRSGSSKSGSSGSGVSEPATPQTATPAPAPGLSTPAAPAAKQSGSVVSGSGSSETGLSETATPQTATPAPGSSTTTAPEAQQTESVVSGSGLHGSVVSGSATSETAAPTSGPYATATPEAKRSGSVVSGSGLYGSAVSGFGSFGFGVSEGGVRALLEVVGAVAVTAGAEGASWLGPDGAISVPAERVDCVNSTGAGDAFNAGFLTAWLAGADPRAALESGVRAGAKAVEQVGAWPVSPR